MVISCCGTVVCLVEFGGESWTALCLGVSLLALLCVMGFGCLYLLEFVFQRPLAGLAKYSRDILEGEYQATRPPTGGLDASLVSSITDLANGYKEKLGFSQSILDGLPMPSVIVDTGERITFLNRECLDMLGLDVAPETYYGRMLSQIFYKDDRKSVIGTCMDENSRRNNIEAVFKHANGSDIDVLANLFPLHDVEGTVIGGCCIYLDTTELKKRQAQVQEQNEQIATAAGEAEGVVLELTTAANQLKSLVTDARDGASRQARRTAETATAMEEMNASILEVARHTQDASANAGNAKENAEEGESTVLEVIGAINEVAGHAEALKASMDDLDGRAEEIGKVLSVIEDIADQTNLLALNAAIEAARAGEAGRGFAVVADEVRKLAEKTMQATTEVHSAVSGIQEGARTNADATETAVEAVRKSTELAGRSEKVLAQIVAVAESTAQQTQAIAAAAEEQSAASEQISRATVEVNQISSETDEAMAESAEAINNLSALARRLSGVIEGMRSRSA